MCKTIDLSFHYNEELSMHFKELLEANCHTRQLMLSSYLSYRQLIASQYLCCESSRYWKSQIIA